MIPEFTSEGLLPPGEHKVTLSEVERRFGKGSPARGELVEGLRRALLNLQAAGVKKVFIDGSFTTNKKDPQDIDGCWEMVDTIDLSMLDPVFLDFRNCRQRMKNKYGVDFFPSQRIEGVSGYPFKDFFQRDANGNLKGILVIKLGDKP